MKKYLKLILPMVMVSLVSCGPKSKDISSALTPARLDELSKTLCTDGKKAVEKSVTGKWEDLTEGADAFVFSLGKGNCALTLDVH